MYRKLSNISAYDEEKGIIPDTLLYIKYLNRKKAVLLLIYKLSFPTQTRRLPYKAGILISITSTELFIIQALKEDIRPVLILAKANQSFNEKEISVS